jgi:hypothetical protein
MPNESNDVEKVASQPTPFSFGLGEIKLSDGSKLASIRLDTVIGEIHLAMPPEFMANMAAALAYHANTLKATSLSVAQEGDLEALFTKMRRN